MSDTPYTERLIDNDGAFVEIAPSIADTFVPTENMRNMERLLRCLRANANGYVSPSKLQEIDDFLNQK